MNNSPTPFRGKKRQLDVMDISEEKPTRLKLEYVQEQSNHTETDNNQSDIYTYLYSVQAEYVPTRDYLDLNVSITKNMMSVLLDWLVDVCNEYHLCDETLYRAKNYIDRFFCTDYSVTRNKLQLVGITTLLLASKMEEVFPPGVDDFVYITDNTYTRQEVLEMEKIIVQRLDFKLLNPTALEFFMRYCMLCNLSNDSRAMHLGKYLMELCLLECVNLAFFWETR